MPRLLLFLFCCLLCFPLDAQTLNGKIINGLGEEGLPNVRVEVQGFSTVFSDAQVGTFGLDLPGLRPGMKVPLDIQKEGYAVINREATQPYLPDNPLDRVKIHMAPVDQRDEMALQFYKISVERNIEVNFESAAKRFAEEANYEAIGKLHQDKESALKLADSLAARLARFDPRASSQDLTQAIQLYQNGQIEEALSVLNVDTIMLRIQDKKEAIEQDKDVMRQAAVMALSQLQFAKAQRYYEALVLVDTSNIQDLQALCEFLLTQNQSQALVKHARRMVRYSEADSEDLGKALNYLGIALREQHLPDSAMMRHREAVRIYRTLSTQLPNAHELELANSLNNLGRAYFDLTQLDQALSAYQEAIQIGRAAKESRNADKSLCVSLNKLGVVFDEQDRYKEAIAAFEEILKIANKQIDQGNPQFEIEVVYAQSNLGNAHKNLNQFQVAQAYYEQALLSFRRLNQENPQRFQPYLAGVLDNLGQVHRNIGNYEVADSVLKAALVIRQKLNEQNPSRYAPDLALTYTHLGNVYQDLNLFEEAIDLQEQAHQIYLDLSKEQPVLFEPYLALILTNLGVAYSIVGEGDTAVALLRRSASIKEKLVARQPEIYQDDLLSSQLNLATVLGQIGRLPDAKTLLKQALELANELFDLNPEKYEPSIALIHGNLGYINGTLENYTESVVEFEKSISMYRKLAQQNSPAFEPALAIRLILFAESWQVRIIRQYEEGLKPEQEWIENGREIVQSADSSLARNPAIPFMQSLQKEVLELNQFFQIADKEEFREVFEIYDLLLSIDRTDSIPRKISIKSQIIEILDNADQKFPQSEFIQDSLTHSLYILAAWQLFNQDYADAEISSRKSMTYLDSFPQGNRWLAPALLFQGKVKEAKSIYQRWAPNPWPSEVYGSFRAVFLSDLSIFESQGITHPDIEKIRTLLAE